MATTLFVIAMGVYYFWRTVAITPQYDELYTYYSFISRGPIYAAIHWPLPNNHVGYSVLSAFMDYLGNPYIGLRGISFMCAVSNLILIYRICKRYFAHGLAYGGMLLYASMQVVNEYSVQGRGYTLGTTCFLLTIYTAGYICSVEETKKYIYVCFIFALVLGLYTIPSSIYWVIPVCGGMALYLLKNAFYKKFVRFFRSGLIAAAITVFLYTLIWLAIGSNLLVKTEGSAFFGLSHLTVLVRAPIRSLVTGIEYMLSQPYIQSLSAADFKSRFAGWLVSLFVYMQPRIWFLIPVALMIAFVITLSECIRHFSYSRTVINLIYLSCVVVTPLMLVIQRKLPYLRVFGYFSFIVTIAACASFERLINVTIRLYNRQKLKKQTGDANMTHKEIEQTIKDDKWYSGFGVYIPAIALLILFVLRTFDSDFRMQLGGRENDVFNTLYIADIPNRSNPAVLDCDQQYLLKFGWGIDCTKTDVDGADCVIIDKNMMTPGYAGPDFWKFYRTYETIDWNYIETMRAVYENDSFILYIK